MRFRYYYRKNEKFLQFHYLSQKYNEQKLWLDFNNYGVKMNMNVNNYGIKL